MRSPTRALRIRTGIARFLRDERATTAIEYALIASVISIVIVGAAASVGTSLESFFGEVAEALSSQ